MNITIFGGTGKAGILTLQAALAQGHKVTAYARSASKITFSHDNLRVVEGELTDYEQIEQGLLGSEAVISLLGPLKKSKEPEITNGYKNIISIMKKRGIKRLVTAVSSSYKDPSDRFQFMVEFGIILLKILASPILKDIVGTGNQIRNSGLDWVMIRIPMLKSTPAVGKINIGYTGDGNFNFFKLTRIELADFLVKQLNDNTYLHKAPAVSNP
jgi:hypothetical protein